MDIQLTKMMAKIQKMLVLADHPNTGAEEAATFRAKVEELMREYRIAEEDLIATDVTADISPILHTFVVAQPGNKLMYNYAEIVAYAAGHSGVRISTEWGKEGLAVNLVGYEIDVRVTEMLYTAARLVFSERIDPQYNPDESDELNCYRLRSAGWLRKDIAERVLGENNARNRSRVTSMYKAECRRRGERAELDGSFNAIDFRKAYVEGFLIQFYRRLARARDAADTTRGALVLPGRKERVDEVFYAYFPYLRPSDEVEVRESAPVKAKKQTKADARREYRRWASPGARVGLGMGREAADQVELTRSTPAGRINS